MRIFLYAFLFLGFGCFNSWAEQIIGFDDFGKKIVLQKPPERIAVISATPLAAIFELGGGNRIIAVPNKIDFFYPEVCRRYPSLLEKPHIGSFDNPNIEKIISLNPDLIILYASLENPGKYTSAFERYTLPYASFCTPIDVAFGLDQIKRLGVLLGKKKEAEKLTRKIKKEIDTIANKVSSAIKTRPLVFYWWGTGNGTYGRKASIHELIELSGGIHLAGEFDKQWFEISPEYIISKNPDVIIISYWQENQKEIRIKEIKERQGFKHINAVKNNRIYLIDGNSIHSIIRFPEAMRNLVKFIHPEIEMSNKGQVTAVSSQRDMSAAGSNHVPQFLLGSVKSDNSQLTIHHSPF
ncbi:MAG: ABC transporter substrate-binding protein [bacterium]